MKISPELLSLIDPLIDAIADRVVVKLGKRDSADGWVDARSSGLGVRTFRRAAKAREFPVHLVGKRWVARRADVDTWISAQKVSFDRELAGEEQDAFERAIASGKLRVVGARK